MAVIADLPSCSDANDTLPKGGRGGWWIASILSLVGLTALGLPAALALPRLESDWTGARALLPVAGGSGLGAILCVVLAVVSLVKRERGSTWAVVVAVPCLVGLLWNTAVMIQDRSRQADAKKNRTLTEARGAAIRTDPEVVLRERWDRQDRDHQFCFENSFGDPAVSYTERQLRRIYDEAPTMRGVVFQHPACPPDFLAAHFQEAWDPALRRDVTMLASIAANPRTPLELVEQVARAPHRTFTRAHLGCAPCVIASGSAGRGFGCGDGRLFPVNRGRRRSGENFSDQREVRSLAKAVLVGRLG